MKDASQYPVSFPYAATSSPYSVTHPHRGEDRAMPSGTPLVINDQTVAMTGNTGKSTGPHLHIQKVKEGVVVSPNGGGFTLAEPVVTEIGENSEIGKYIRIKDAAGVVWSYFHLSEIKVTKGQKIGEPMVNEGDIINIYRAAIGRDPNTNDIAYWTGKDWKSFTYDLVARPDFGQHLKTDTSQYATFEFPQLYIKKG